MKINASVLRKTLYCGCISLLLMIASCGSSRKAVAPSATVIDKQTQTTVTKVESNRQTAHGVRGKAQVSIGSLSASGTVKMKRDEIIQVSLSALLGLMEVGRLEMTPDYFFVLDRINHEYVRIRWEEVPELREAGINFYTFQGLFWEELFVPGKMQTPEAADFDVQQNGNGMIIEPKGQAEGKYAMMVKFLVEASTGIIRQATITSPKVPSLRLDWIYSSWSSLDGKSFPAEMLMSMISSTGSNSVKFKFSNMQIDENMGMIGSPMPGSNYTQMDVNKLFSRLMK